MNILLITTTYFPKRGGTEQVIYEVINRLKNYHDITVVTIQKNNSLKFEYVDEIPVYRINQDGFPGFRFSHLNRKLLKLVKKLMNEKTFDLIHLFHVYEFSKAVINLKNKTSLPLITSLMGWDTYDPDKKVPNRYLKYVTKVMNIADILTSPSHHLGECAKKFQGCNNKVTVIPHGTNFINYPKNQLYNIRAKYSIKPSTKLFISIQRVDKRKGLEYLIQAIPLILKKHTDIHFIVGGKGPEEKNLKTLTKELNVTQHVTFAGFIEDSLLPSFYNDADFFILPSLYEAFGLVYVDAFAFGTPILTTLNGGTKDICDSNNGIMFKKKNPEDIERAVDLAIQKVWDYKSIVGESKKYAWDNIVSQYRSVYSLLLNKKRNK